MTDNVTYFPSPKLEPPAGFTPLDQHRAFTNPSKPVLIIREGVKLRGSDEKPLTELSAEELLTVIDDLCLLIAQ